jgi:hypothetical protein
MLPHLDTLSGFRANQSLLSLLNAACLVENTNFIVFGLTRPGLEPRIYHTRGEYANHYMVAYGKENQVGNYCLFVE